MQARQLAVSGARLVTFNIGCTVLDALVNIATQEHIRDARGFFRVKPQIGDSLGRIAPRAKQKVPDRKALSFPW